MACIGKKNILSLSIYRLWRVRTRNHLEWGLSFEMELPCVPKYKEKLWIRDPGVTSYSIWVGKAMRRFMEREMI
jgi:hypothetical protein